MVGVLMMVVLGRTVAHVEATTSKSGELIEISQLGLSVDLNSSWSIESPGDYLASFWAPMFHDAHDGKDYGLNNCTLAQSSFTSAKAAYRSIHDLASRHNATFVINIKFIGKSVPFYLVDRSDSSTVEGYFNVTGVHNVAEFSCQMPVYPNWPEMRYILPPALQVMKQFATFVHLIPGSTGNAESPIADRQTAIWTCEKLIWEGVSSVGNTQIANYNAGIITAAQLTAYPQSHSYGKVECGPWLTRSLPICCP